VSQALERLESFVSTLAHPRIPGPRRIPIAAGDRMDHAQILSEQLKMRLNQPLEKHTEWLQRMGINPNPTNGYYHSDESLYGLEVCVYMCV
jgi:hypothetical protein